MRRKLLITAKYFVGKYKGISSITDYLELTERLIYASSHSKLEKPILIKMVELNRLQLPKITNYSELEFRLLKTIKTMSISNSNARKQIEARMHELNRISSDYSEMLKRFERSDRSSKLGRQIKKKMYDLNEIQLPGITNYNKLTERLSAVISGSKIEKQIEARICDLNENCSDYSELVNRWRKSEYNLKKFRGQIEARIMKVLENEETLIQALLGGRKNLPFFLKDKLKYIAEKVIG